MTSIYEPSEDFAAIQKQEQNRKEFAVCRNCRFFDVGDCKRNAPVVIAKYSSESGLPQKSEFFPHRWREETCGDFKPDYSRPEVIEEFRRLFPRQVPKPGPFPY